MLVLISANNFPDVMFPLYKATRLGSLFFIVYLVLGVYFLMNLLLAIFYNNYKQRGANTLERFDNSRLGFLRRLFNRIDRNERGYITRGEAHELISRLIRLDRGIPSHLVSGNQVVSRLDTACSGRIQLTESLKFYDLVDSIVEEHAILLRRSSQLKKLRVRRC